MPQIWMTYDELGSLLQCSPKEARDQAMTVYADRKVSRDGFSRVKLNAAWMELFIDHVRSEDRFDRAATELHALPHMQSPLQPSLNRLRFRQPEMPDSVPAVAKRAG